ncbi:MAG: putative glycoside hydrolase [Anaerolineae bacterium]
MATPLSAYSFRCEQTRIHESSSAKWDYNIAIAIEAAGKGFDEIQFDYVRFPTDGKVKTAQFSKENNPIGQRRRFRWRRR